MADRPTMAVVIVSFNVRDDLDRCLQSVVKAIDGCQARITVVDNGSRDGTVAMLRERWPEVCVVTPGGNLGFARANNLGIRQTPGELVLLLNPDTVVAPPAVDRLVEALATTPDAAAAGPRLVDADRRAELSFGRAISPTAELRQKLLMAGYAWNVGPVVRLVERWTRMPGDREWLSGACLLLRRLDLEAVGLLDERYFMYYEDVDLCVALRQRGRRVLFVPDAEVQHLRGRSGGHNPELERRRRESQLAYYRKHHPRWAPVVRWYFGIRP